MGEMTGEDFAGRTALVTGGASGIGLECVRQLTSKGARVFALDRRPETMPEADRARCAEVIAADVCDREAISELAARLEPDEVSLLINCAGIVQDPHPPAALDGAVFDDVLAVSLAGSFNICREFGARMAQRGRGAVVNIASVAGMRSMPLHAYSPAKAGVINLTECLAAEWGRSGVRVNTVSPGYTVTAALQSQIDKGLRDPEKLKKNSALNRLVFPEHIAEAVLFLLSDAAEMITGANLPVDAGWLVAGSWSTFGGVRESAEGRPLTG